MSALRALPSMQALEERFSYCQHTGLLFWKERPDSHFKTPADATRWRSRWVGKPCQRITGGGKSTDYYQVQVDSTTYLAHRIIWKMVHGEEPPEMIDHIDGDGTNNRTVNLRAADNSLNQRNAVSQRDRPFPVGVHYMPSKKAFKAEIGVGGGKSKYLGLFPTANLAHAARRGAEVILGYSQRQR